MSVFMKVCTGLMVSALSFSAQAANVEPQQPQNPGQNPQEQMIDVTNTPEVIQALYVANQSEINISDLIKERSTDEEMTAFADKLSRDHSFQNKLLEVIANVKSVSLNAEELSENVQLIETEAKAEFEALAATEEADFRPAVLEAVIESHEKALELLNRIEAESTDDAVKLLVSVFRQMDETHLSDAQKLQGSVGQPQPQQPSPELPQPQQPTN